MLFWYFFFFSSRRRHTRSYGDWSSDVCSSDLRSGPGSRAYRPATALTDTLSNQDPIAQALWREQRERTLASIKRIRAGLPSPRLPIHDPWALRDRKSVV